MSNVGTAAPGCPSGRRPEGPPRNHSQGTPPAIRGPASKQHNRNSPIAPPQVRVTLQIGMRLQQPPRRFV